MSDPLTPPRRPGSVRRTTTIDMTWPDGPRAELVLAGRARDLVTSGGRDLPEVRATARLAVTISPARTVAAIAAEPDQFGLDAFVGGGAIKGFRRALAGTVPVGGPLHQLLDDVPGAAIVSDFAQRQWDVYADVLPDGRPAPPRRVVGFCTGFADGSSALNPDGSSSGAHRRSLVDYLPDPDDPIGWHEFAESTLMSMRRARRIDAWIDGDEIIIDAMFQDSCTPPTPTSGRLAVHQYHVRVGAAADSGRVRTLSATPGNLPYAECPMATASLPRLVGSPLAELRTTVAEQLRGVAGCTHLNDALRALADVPALLEPARLR